jgi:Asp-tRNA(Asn)/Glu-tRNA(Gln) amidotransferase A subunit family amidase
MRVAAAELWRMSATELAGAIRSGQASSRDVIEAHLRRIEAVNPSVSAITSLLAEQALEAARAADRRAAGGGALPRLHGVPFTVKENIDLAGALLRAWGEFQETHPLIAAPISTGIPFEAGTDLADGAVAETIEGMRMAIAINALGLPAVALPVGIADGLPQAVQLIGPRYREDLCLDAAAALEDRLGIITPIDPRQPDGNGPATVGR